MVKAFRPPFLSTTALAAAGQANGDEASSERVEGVDGITSGSGSSLRRQPLKSVPKSRARSAAAAGRAETDSTFSSIISPASSVERHARSGGVLSGAAITVDVAIERRESKGLESHQGQKEGQGRTLTRAESKGKLVLGADGAMHIQERAKGYNDIEWTFKTTFKKSHYKGQQEAIMKAALEGIDILVIASTGFGKSLCFQVPAVAEQHGLTLVVSPLLSLMKDQIAALKLLDIPAAMLSSKSSQAEQSAILNDMGSGHPKNRLLYITPERLSSPAFKKRLSILVKQNELSRLVVDEAHCISEWGHDFRPDYAKIGRFREEFPNVPIMALTASATPKVQNDIVAELGMNLDALLKAVHPFNRINLFYEVRYYSESTMPSDHRRNDLLLFIQKLSRGKSHSNGNAATRTHTLATAADIESHTSRVGVGAVLAKHTVAGIVYCRAKSTCDEVAAFLRGKGIMAAPYHRGLKDTEADTNQRRWINKELDAAGPKVECIVATIAFGLGLDKGNCSYVVHYDIPKSFEGYYQETGRAGRDSHAARCLLYYSAEDKERIRSMVGRSYRTRVGRRERDGGIVPSQRAPESIDAMLAYAENVNLCRHVAICRYFGESIAPSESHKVCNKMCDICKDPAKTKARRREGLVDLDFAQTQAVVAATQREEEIGEGSDVEERDPEDYYPDATMKGRKAGQEDQREDEDQEEDVLDGLDSIDEDEEDDDDSIIRKRRRLEGFRSAAVERKREIDRETKSREESLSFDIGSSNSGDEDEPMIQDEVVPLRQVHVENEDCVVESDAAEEELVEEELEHFPSAAQSSTKRKSSTIIIDDGMDEDQLAQPDSSGEVFIEPPPKKMTKTTPAAQGSTSVAVSRNAIASTAVLPPPADAAPRKGKAKFETPFLDLARRPAAKIIKPLAPSSTDDPITIKYLLDPPNYDKNIPASMRHQTVIHLEKYLSRAFFSKHGNRTSANEELVWKELGAAAANHALRRKILLYTAIDLESDLFWTALTPLGYQQFVTPLSAATKRLITSLDDDEGSMALLPMEGEDGEVDGIVTMLRASALRLMRDKKRTKKKHDSSDSEDE